ncbi:MAG: Cell wall-associated hydrolase [Chloroflexi bacterium]|nr:Cell wall-associated hydrolase [Chloroflexota bacterium]
MSWVYSPQWQVAVAKVNAARQQISDLYLCETASDVECTLSTGATVGEAHFKLADTDGLITHSLEAAPHAMDVVTLLLRNRHNQWGIAWTGVIDSAVPHIDPNEGVFINIKATSPQKYFEVRRQTQNDVLALAAAAIIGVKGSDVLRFACAAQRVNFPGPLLGLPDAIGHREPWYQQAWIFVDPQADSGMHSWSQGIASGIFTAPDYQPWNAVLSPLSASSGLEWFFDECGRLVWRLPGFLQDTRLAKAIPLDEILSLDMGESDQDVVTRIEVRWGVLQNTQTAAYWQAPPAMVQQLGSRTLTVPAEWVVGQDEAMSLAQLMGQFYAANMLIGSVTVPANSYYQVGSLVEIPTVKGHTGGIFYVAAKMISLHWGGQCVEILGLKYGRNKHAQFPMLGKQTYSSLYLLPDKVSKTDPLASLQFNVGTNQNIFTLVLSAGVKPGQVIADPKLLPVGATIRMRNAGQGIGVTGADAAQVGAVAGTSPNGEYTVLAGKAGQGYVLYVSDIGKFPQVYIDIQDPGPGVDPTLRGNIKSSNAPNASGAGSTPRGSYFPSTPDALAAAAATLGHPAINLAQEALGFALAQHKLPYISGTQGPGSFDCSGLVYFAYVSSGYSWPRLTAGAQYRYLLGNGAVERSLSETPQDGDLLFYGDMNDVNRQHVGFYVQGGLYSAMNDRDGIGTVNDYLQGDSYAGLSVTHVLNMQNFGVTTVAAPVPTGSTGNFTPASINTATGLVLGPPLGVTSYWPVIYGALTEVLGPPSVNTQIAAIAMTGKETSFVTLDENNPTAPYAPYWGRGFIQLTWSYNYKMYGDLLGVDLYNNPSFALEPSTAARILAWYFKQHGIPALADARNWQGVADEVNRGDPRSYIFLHYVTQLGG